MYWLNLPNFNYQKYKELYYKEHGLGGIYKEFKKHDSLTDHEVAELGRFLIENFSGHSYTSWKEDMIYLLEPIYKSKAQRKEIAESTWTWAQYHVNGTHYHENLADKAYNKSSPLSRIIFHRYIYKILLFAWLIPFFVFGMTAGILFILIANWMFGIDKKNDFELGAFYAIMPLATFCFGLVLISYFGAFGENPSGISAQALHDYLIWIGIPALLSSLYFAAINHYGFAHGHRYNGKR